MNLKLITGAAALLAAAGAPAAVAAPSNEEILKGFAEDFTQDPYLTGALRLGVEVGDQFYTIDVAPGGEGREARTNVSAGKPSEPVFYFTVENRARLEKLHAGKMNALTMMAAAFSSDVTPLDIEVMEGFEPPENFGEWIIPFIFHFWTKGTPEIVSFADQETRVTHGANVGVFYYQSGLRSAWFDIRPGQHVNEDERSRENPFPSMFFLLKGEVTAIIDNERMTFTEGNMMFIPAGVTHQFVNEGDAAAFGLLFMFGEGA